jgi:hypothetical protein
MSLAATDNGDSSESFETFDNFDDAEVSGEEANDDWSKEEPAPKAKAKDEGLKVLDDTDVDADGDVVEKEEKIKKPAKKEESEEEVEDEEPLVENDDNELPEDKKGGKKLRLRMADGDLYNIDADSTIPVKIDGKTEEIPMQELINNYSGKTAWDKKFTEIGKEKKTLEFEKASLTKQKESLTHHLNMALGPIKDINKNPIDSLLYLVEMSGEDPYNAYRRIMEANLEEIGTLMDLSEVERELYFHKKKDELHNNVARKRSEKQQSEQTFNQAVQRIDSLRQAHNVTEGAFVDASEELESIYKESGLDINSVTDEAIVDYASLKPHIATVRELVEPYVDNISEEKYGDVVAELSRYLRDGKADEASIKQILARNFSVEEDVKELNSKVYGKSAKAPVKKALKEESGSLESFDDWE